jgi:hypothetical protein
VIANRDYESIKNQLLQRYVNGGRPVIQLTSFSKDGIELLHKYDGQELEEQYVERTMKMMYNIVNMPIHLKTKVLKQPKAKTYGQIFAIQPDLDAPIEVHNRVYKYDGNVFKHWENYKNKDFPKSG